MEQYSRDLLLEPLFTIQQLNLGEYPQSPAQRVQKWADGEKQVFCELLELCQETEQKYYWMEKARWIKFEETVEGCKQRWSKPKIPLLTIQGVFQLKNCLKRGTTLFDVEAKSFQDIVEKIVKTWASESNLRSNNVESVKNLLLSRKEHCLQFGLRKKISSFVINRKISREQSHASDLDRLDEGVSTDIHNLHNLEAEIKDRELSMNELTRKLPEFAEVAVIFIGRSVNIRKPLSCFLRVAPHEKIMQSNSSEVQRALRFVFVLLIPETHQEEEWEMIGRSLGAMLTDDMFVHIAYEAQSALDLLAGLDAFLSNILIIPPGKWNPEVRLEPNEVVPSKPVYHGQKNGDIQPRRTILKADSILEEHHFDGLQFSGRIFGGLVDDVKRKVPFYISDYKDAANSASAITQCLASSLFLFFANLTNIVTFGGVMGSFLKKEMAVMECIISGCLSGIIFGIFSGQPLNILSATGPVLIFETLFYKFCDSYQWDFMSARFWLGFWVFVQIIILVASDASFLVAYITRFTEENFATLIAVIFIAEAFGSLLKLAEQAPITLDPLVMLNDTCRCVKTFPDNSTIIFDNVTTESECIADGAILLGQTCKPDVFLFSVILFFATFVLAAMFQSFKTSSYFPAKLRSVVADFSICLSIMIMTFVSFVVGLNVEKLEVPHEFKPTKERSWFINPSNNEIYVWFVCFVPALLLTVLIVMDQQITAVIVNRKDNKLRKGYGYHLDLLIVGFLVLACSILGLPFFVAATILSISHLQSLRMETENTAPGEKPVFLGVREQRVTTLIAHVLIGLSVFFTSVMNIVPLPVLLGVFLHMGVSCLSSQQFFKRILLLFMPVKHQPEYTFLKLVPLKRVHLFTAIQLGAFALLCAVKYTKKISMVFPILLIVLVGVRKGLDWVFSQSELMALDDVLPSFSALKKQKSENITKQAENGVVNCVKGNGNLSSSTKVKNGQAAVNIPLLIINDNENE